MFKLIFVLNGNWYEQLFKTREEAERYAVNVYDSPQFLIVKERKF